MGKEKTNHDCCSMGSEKTHSQQNTNPEQSNWSANNLLLIGLAAIFVIGAFQTFQLAGTLGELNTANAGQNSVSLSQPAASQQQVGTAQPAGQQILQNLPTQVRGC